MKGYQKAVMCISACVVIASFIPAIAAMPAQESLQEIYNTGKMKLEPLLKVDLLSLKGDEAFGAWSGITIDDGGNVYVSDFKMHNIKKFDPDGKLIGIIGREGAGPGEFMWPSYCTYSRGQLVVWDHRNSRLSSFTSDGIFIRSQNVSTTDGTIMKIRSLPNGDVVVEKIKLIMRPEFKELCRIELYSSQLEFKKLIYSKELNSRKFIRSPRPRFVAQPYSPRVFWDTSQSGMIYIGYSAEAAIEVYDSNGIKNSSFSYDRDPPKISQKAKDRFMKQYMKVDSVGKEAEIPDYIKDHTHFPKIFPKFRGIRVDSENNVIIGAYDAEGGLAPSIDVCDEDGTFIAHVRTDSKRSFAGNENVQYFGNFAWIAWEDEEGLTELVKYRISK